MGQIVREGLAADGITEPAKKTEDINGALDFACAFREGLAFLASQEFRELGFA
jgi:hypothetical protein